MTRVAVLIATVVVCSSPLSGQSKSTPLFSFHSNPWLSLHHFIRAVARQDRTNVEMTREERMVWNAGVMFYKPYVERDVLRNDGMVTIANALHAAEGKTSLDGAAIDADLRRTLQDVMPVYRKYWWPQHDRENREWIAAVTPLVERHGAAISRTLARAYNASWPSNPVEVDLTPVAGPVGGFTTLDPTHVTISSEAADLKGYSSLELLFHESSHAWGGQLINGINAAAKANGVTVPPQLWHVVLFYTAGELTTRELKARGVNDYTMYVVTAGLYGPMCGGCGDKVASAWGSYLDGKRSMNDAFTALVLAFK
ncbi:MAG TPA: hypothetical protein VH436_29090 [Vicinamibacterales bacterium]|jgi:hypothetical protein